jgi:hypothetical protein
MITNIMEYEEPDLVRYFEKLVRIRHRTPEGNIIIYSEPQYHGFRGTCSEGCTNWPES